MALAFNRKLKRFLRRHNRFLTYIGALVVFLTFVVKDGLRENLKDAVGSVSTASDVFAIREDNMETRFDLGDIRKYLITKGASELSLPDIRLVRIKSQQMYYSLGAVAYLMETTHDEADLPQAATLDRELTKIRSDSLNLDQSPATANSLNLSATTLEGKIAQFADEVVRHARIKLQERQDLYERFTWASYGLYVLGWGLSLIGKVYGVGELVGGE